MSRPAPIPATASTSSGKQPARGKGAPDKKVAIVQAASGNAAFAQTRQKAIRPLPDWIVAYNGKEWTVVKSLYGVATVDLKQVGDKTKAPPTTVDWQKTPLRVVKTNEGDSDMRTGEVETPKYRDEVVYHDEFESEEDALERITAIAKQLEPAKKEAFAQIREYVFKAGDLGPHAKKSFVDEVDYTTWAPVGEMVVNGVATEWTTEWEERPSAGEKATVARKWKFTIDVDDTVEGSWQAPHVGWTVEVIWAKNNRTDDPPRKLGHVWLDAVPVGRPALKAK